jgi:LPS O-antigen subunit length determinant protein (WzzB/FepE family)
VDREITIRDYLKVAWSGRWLILTTTIVGIIVGLVVSIAHHGSYSAVARVGLGQPTSVQGNPLSSPLTSAQTAAGSLDVTALADQTAAALRVPPSAVRGHVRVAVPPGVTATVAAPPVVQISGSNASANKAVLITNAFAQQVVQSTGAQVLASERALETQARQAHVQEHLLAGRIAALQGSAAANPSDAVALATDTQLLTTAQTNAANAELTLAQVQTTGAPRVLVQAYSASTTNTAPKRLQSVVLAGLIGFLVGLIATFIWRGSQAARAKNA